MKEKDKEFLIKKWRWYYFNNQDNIKLPYRFQEREFGYRNFEGKMVRHLSFSSENEFKAFLLHKVPQSIFYSVSFYEEPTLPMEQKGWKGADLVFDIDLGDISPKCKEKHDFWICMNCGEWSETFKVKDIRDSIRCRKCKAKLLTIVKPENIRAEKIIKKYLQGKRLNLKEKKYLLKLRQIADLFLVYGRKAVIVLAGKGIGPVTAKKILSEYYKNEDELIHLTLEAERQFFKTRKYWSI